MSSKTITLEVSDAVIRRHANDLDVRELNDSRLPFRFRYGADRTGGSWHVVRSVQGKKVWRKAGSFPALTTKALKGALPLILARMAHDREATAAVGMLETVAEVVSWHRTRLLNDRNISTKRKDTVCSAIKCQLIPLIGGLQLIDITRKNIDKMLLWPMQARYSLGHVRTVFQVLKAAFKKAHKLGVIGQNPMGGILFSDSIPHKIGAKAMRLQQEGMGPLMADLARRFPFRPKDVSLAVLMMCFGTRIGETRRTKWSQISRDRWVIPADVAKTKEALVLPMTEQVWQYLSRYREDQNRRGYTGNLLFPGTRTGRPITERQASEIFAELGAGEWTSHDLRKVARTTWYDLGIDTLTGELLINHKLKGMLAHYIHTHAEEQKRKAVELWHDWLAERGFAALLG